MRAFVPILGAGLATAADAYLRSISPQAELEREEIASQRRLLPLREELLQAQAQRQRALALKGGMPGSAIRRLNATNYLEYNPDTQQWDHKTIDAPASGYAAVQQSIDRITRNEGTPSDYALVDDWKRRYLRFSPQTGQIFDPYQVGTQGATPAPPQLPAPTAGLTPTPGALAQPGPVPNDAMVGFYHNQYRTMDKTAIQQDLQTTMAQDPGMQNGQPLSPVTQAKLEAYRRLFSTGVVPGTPGQRPAPAPPGAGLPPTPGAPGAASGGMITTVPPSPLQQAAEARKAEELRLQQEAEARQQQALLVQQQQANTQQRAPLTQAMADEIKKVQEEARAARSLTQSLSEVERLMNEGVYEQSPTLSAALTLYNSTGYVMPGLGYDAAILARTGRLRELGSQLTVDRAGTLGNQVSEGDRKTYEAAAGRFQEGKTLASMRESVKSMRTIAERAIENANTALTTMQQTNQIPQYQGTPGAAKGTKANPITEQDIQDTLKNPANAGKTRAQLIKEWRDAGFIVEVR